MKEKVKKTVFGAITLCLFVACSSVYKPNVETTASIKGTEIFQPDSASIAEHYKIPAWFTDAKIGIFIHWGIYSVPAYGSEWYSRWMYKKGHPINKHHEKTYGSLTEFGYKDFIPMFKAEKFDASEWAKIFKASGAKYIVPVAEHHDGFAMYNSTFNKWNSVNMGPKRDIIGELKEAVLKENLHFGLSSHRCENAWFYEFGMNTSSDVQDTTITMYGERLHQPEGKGMVPYCGKYEGSNERSRYQFLQHTYELIDMYQPELIWFDWTVGKYPFQPTFYKFLAYYYNTALDWNKEVVVNTKFGFGDNIQVHDIERGKSDRIREYPWQTDTSIGKKSWSYCIDEVNKTPDHIIDDFVDIVSKNGNLLLNVGPKADGTITEEQKNVLMEIGKWLDVNGEAIYSSRPWVVASEGENEGTAGYMTDNTKTEYTAQDIRFTTRDNNLYATSLAWTDGKITIHSLSKEHTKDLQIESVEMLGSNEKIDYRLTDKGLEIAFPKEKPTEYAHVFKIKLKGIVLSEPSVDLVGENCLAAIRVANHSDKESGVAVSSVVNDDTVKEAIEISPKSIVTRKIQHNNVKTANMIYKFYLNTQLAYEKKI